MNFPLSPALPQTWSLLPWSLFNSDLALWTLDSSLFSPYSFFSSSFSFFSFIVSHVWLHLQLVSGQLKAPEVAEENSAAACIQCSWFTSLRLKKNKSARNESILNIKENDVKLRQLLISKVLPNSPTPPQNSLVCPVKMWVDPYRQFFQPQWLGR